LVETSGDIPMRLRSSGKLDPGSSLGEKYGIATGLLPALLDVRLDEILGVRFEYLVDFVKQIVDISFDFVAGLGDSISRCVDVLFSVLSGLGLLNPFGHWLSPLLATAR
jgi:hypothetical protein